MTFDLAAERARLTPSRPAVLWRGRWITYEQLDQRASAMASRLAARGVRRGDRVAILAHNHLAHLELLLAAPKLGFIYVPFNHRLVAAEQRALAQRIEPCLVFHDDANAAAAQAIGADRLDLAVLEDGAPGVQFEPANVDPADTHMILFTGGSTGVPKGARITYRQVRANARNTNEQWQIDENDCAIQATPAFHAAVNVLATPLLHAGGRVIWPEAFEPGEYLALAQAQGVTAMFMVPTMFQLLAEHPSFASATLPNVRFAITGGAPCPPAVRNAFASRGIAFRLGFGMTECGVNCFSISSEEARQHPESVGRPMPGLEAVIRAPDGQPVESGAVGELTLRGELVCAGYYGQDAETKHAIRDGWLWTGDLARVDADGRYYIAGRRKEMYISGGENVYPAEVEVALSQCTGVAECAVIGVPSEKWGETGVAFVAPRAGAALSPEALRAELRSRLAGYKIPGEFRFVDSLPKTATGKIAKVDLLALHRRGS